MTWLPDTAGGETAFDRVLALCPELQADFVAFTELFDRLLPLDPELVTLCAARIAQILGREADARAAGLSADALAALAGWRDGAHYDPRQRDCLAFAEKFVLDPHGISDADAAAVTAHLTPPEMVAFVEALAIYDGFIRFRIILDV